MKKLKSFIFLYLIALALLASGCAKEETVEEIEEISDEDNGIEETEADAEIGTGETGEAEIDVISEEDAKSLAVELLPEDGFSLEFYGSLSKDEKDYYIFEVSKDGAALSQMLAVNDESGEVFVYDEKESVISSIDTFEFYDSKKDSSVNWSGVYRNENYEVSIDNTDPGNIEYSILKDRKNVFVNAAYFKDYATAVSETDEYGIVTLELGDGVLTISAEKECEFAGSYNIALLR